MFGGPRPFRQSVEPVRESPVASQAGLSFRQSIRFASTRPIKRAFDAEETQQLPNLPRFFDLAVAAPSMKAAAEAWGSRPDDFKRVFAKRTDDPAIVAATEQYLVPLAPRLPPH
jgi:hypothetical protein